MHKQSSYTYIYNKLANHIIYLLNPTGGVLHICTYLCTVYTVYVWCYIMHVHTHAPNMHKVLFHSYIYTYICRYLATHYIYIVDNIFTLDHDLKPKDTFNNQTWYNTKFSWGKLGNLMNRMSFANNLSSQISLKFFNLVVNKI